MLVRAVQAAAAAGGLAFSAEAAVGELVAGRRASDTLGRRLFSSAVIALNKWAEDGKTVQRYQLNRVVRELRTNRRYKNALEICERKKSPQTINLLPGVYAFCGTLSIQQKTSTSLKAAMVLALPHSTPHHLFLRIHPPFSRPYHSLLQNPLHFFSLAFTKRRFSSNTNSPISFNFSDSDDDDGEKLSKKPVDPSKLPPPYDPFNKKPVIHEPDDPMDLQQVFHQLRSDGLMSSAVKMFDGLSKDGLTHEALALFSQIKDKGAMPDVVAHTAIIEAYANAGRSKEALKSYMRMLSSGVKPNAYTYAVLIKCLSRDGKLGDAKKYLLEMMSAGMRPNAGTYTTMFEAYVKGEKVEDGKELLEEMKARGFVPDEKAVREQLDKRGPMVRGIMGLLFNK